jgi:hypothetical protein
MLPLYLEMSQGQFSSSFEQLQHFEACKDRPHVLDDDIVNRTIKLHEEQKEYNLLTLEQCRLWRLQKPSAEELGDIEIVDAPYTNAIGNAVRKIYGFCLPNGALTHMKANMSF